MTPDPAKLSPIPVNELPQGDPIPEPRFKTWWAGTDVLKVKIGDEIQTWRRTDSGFRKIS